MSAMIANETVNVETSPGRPTLKICADLEIDHSFTTNQPLLKVHPIAQGHSTVCPNRFPPMRTPST